VHVKTDVSTPFTTVHQNKAIKITNRRPSPSLTHDTVWAGGVTNKWRKLSRRLLWGGRTTDDHASETSPWRAEEEQFRSSSVRTNAAPSRATLTKGSCAVSKTNFRTFSRPYFPAWPTRVKHRHCHI